MICDGSQAIDSTHNSRDVDAGIAVIGMAGRFPGAPDVATFWSNLLQGKSGITDVVPSPQSQLPTQANYVNKSAVVKNADHFDASFFGVIPKQAGEMDPQHRLFLETCWLAMEDAGYVPGSVDQTVGVFAGCHMNTYIFCRLAEDQGLRESLADTFPGGSLTAEILNDKDYLATRVAFHLGLTGPCVAVQSACSTSLVAIAQACESLQLGSCDLALSGGATITFPQEQGYLHTPDSILSPDGVCRAFDANAQGTIFGDGVGAVVLKRVDDAARDRDPIYAVIKGWGVNNDGRDKQGYTAPSIEGQAAAIRLAHKRAGIQADSISHVEAHGTGTAVGDPIEIEALTRAFRDTTDKKQFCKITSIKTAVGHLDVAAGVAGVIKTCMALRDAKLPPMQNFVSPNPAIPFEDSPFEINTAPADWDHNPTGTPRRAGVSSFGVGGTNAHMVLEEAPDSNAANTANSSSPLAQILPLSAKSELALSDGQKQLGEFLQHTSEDLADCAFTLQNGRATFRHRSFVVADNPQDTSAQLLGEKRSTNDLPARLSPLPIAFLFPGQGSQHTGMAAELYQSEPEFQLLLDEALEATNQHSGAKLEDLIYEDIGSDRIHQTVHAQPALFAVSYAVAAWWKKLGVQPSVLIGHSVGEFAAAVIAGIMDLEDAAKLVAIRGRLMQDLAPGSMLALRISEDELRPLLSDGLEIAAVNAPELCVASGPSEHIDGFAERLTESDVVCTPIRTSHAFHSSMMDPALQPFLEAFDNVTLREPETPMISTVTGEILSADEACSPEYWANQIRSPVRFSSAVNTLLKTDSEIALLETGPSQTLTGLARQHLLSNSQFALASLPHAKQVSGCRSHVLNTLGELWTAGHPIDWSQMNLARTAKRVHLPGYCFQRRRYWFTCGSSLTPNEPQPAATSAPHTEAAGTEPARVGDLTSPPMATTQTPSPPAKENTNTHSNFMMQVIVEQTRLMQQQVDALSREQQTPAR